MYDDYDIHAIWRIVANNWRSMEEHAPEGFEPVTRVHLLGSPEAIPINRVETHRRHGVVMLFVTSEGDDPAEAHPSDRFIFADHRQVGHVEITYERKGGPTPIGFIVEESEIETELAVGVTQQ